MEIKIDLRRHIKNMREQFQDRLRWVSEFIQNAQRSGASKITFDLSPSSVSVWDDGCGCPDPDDLFTIAASGWTNLQGESPFGTGFFSVLGIADTVYVRSHDWTALLNVSDLLNGDLNSVKLTRNESDFYDGFFVELRIANLDADEITDTIGKEGLHVPLTVIVDGSPIRQAALHEFAGKSAVFVKSALLDGYVEPSSWGSVDTYHKYRRVNDLYKNAHGKVVFLGAHPRCPDRTGWIQDPDFRAAETELDAAISNMYLAIWKSGNTKQIEEFGEAINRRCQIKGLMDGHSFVMINDKKTSLVYEKDKPEKAFYALHGSDKRAVDKAVYLGFSVIISSNVVEDALLKMWDLPEIRDLEKNYKLVCDYKISDRPELAHAFSQLGALAGFPGKVQAATINVKKVYCEDVAEPFPVRGLCKDGLALIHHEWDKLSAKDFVLQRIVDIAHEVAHLFGYDDGDPKHDKKQLELIELWLPKLDEIIGSSI